MRLIYLVGTTCTGKDYMIEKTKKYHSDVGCVNVGAELRRRYPPERFRGLGAMSDTEAEALAIFDEQILAQKDCRKILVSGQPRLISQISTILGRYTLNEEIWWLWAPEIVLLERINQRFPNDPESRKLALSRVHNDARDLYGVMHHVLRTQRLPIFPIATANDFNHKVFFKSRGL